MMERVKRWLSEGYTIKIFTARASDLHREMVVRAWLDSHGLQACGITNVKDFGMIELYDDRCVAVEPNTGKLLTPSRRGMS